MISQIGGRYVQVSAIMSNPNTDPHTFEASPTVAQEVSRAQLVVQNGVGYDDFMSKIESASSDDQRQVIDVQQLEHLPDSTPNPHLWYKPTTMPLVARALVADLSALAPGPRRLLQGQRRPLRREPSAVDAGAAPVRGRLPGGGGGDDRAGRRLHAAGRRNRQPHPVLDAGRHHERHRSGAAGGQPAERAVLRPPGQGVRLQPAGDRLGHRRSSSSTPAPPGFRSSGCTRRCRPPATTTSPG